MPRLYELSDQYNALSGLLENTEVDQAEVLEELNAIEGQFNVKAENIAKLILSMVGDIVVIQAEEQRLTTRKRRIEKQLDYLKSYLYTKR